MFVAVYKSVHNVQCVLVHNLVSQLQACTVFGTWNQDTLIKLTYRWSTASTNK